MMLSYSGQDCDSLNALLDFWKRNVFNVNSSHVLLPIPSQTVISQVKNTAVNTDVFWWHPVRRAYTHNYNDDMSTKCSFYTTLRSVQYH